MQLDGRLSITRPMGAGESYIKISIQDESSRVEFVEVRVSLADFAECLTGLSYIPVKMEVGDLDKVGKKKVVERAQFELTKEYLEEKGVNQYSKTGLRQLLKDDPDKLFQRDGWHLNSYLGSQGSIQYSKEGVVIINTSYTTFVEITE